MSKPVFPVAGPWPRLSADLPLCDPGECAQCGTGCDLAVWQECDTGDNPEPIFVVLCSRCSDLLIDPHPRLYHLLQPNQPAPGVMPLCLNCGHRAGSRCWHRQGHLRGGPGLKLEHPSPIAGFWDGQSKGGGKRTGGPFTLYTGIVYACAGKELDLTSL